jgi:hypothetical protein
LAQPCGSYVTRVPRKRMRCRPRWNLAPGSTQLRAAFQAKRVHDGRRSVAVVLRRAATDLDLASPYLITRTRPLVDPGSFRSYADTIGTRLRSISSSQRYVSPLSSMCGRGVTTAANRGRCRRASTVPRRSPTRSSSTPSPAFVLALTDALLIVAQDVDALRAERNTQDSKRFCAARWGVLQPCGKNRRWLQ